MSRHYLDHASTVPLRPEAAAAIESWLGGTAADPGRLHQEGREIRGAIEAAREEVAGLLGARPREVVFTAGGTEAVNMATWGATRRSPGAPVVCAAVEHRAVRDASARLAPVVTVPVDRAGRVSVDAVREALAAPVVPALVHCQWANHEVGTLQPVPDVVAAARAAGVPVHLDAAAACGHVPLALDDLGADLVSVSAHKLGGPPGVGALFVRRGLRIDPLVVGGDQERGRRAGMENVPGVLAFGAAAAALAASGGRQIEHEAARSRGLTGALLAAATAVPGVSPVGDPDPGGRLPHLVCLGVEGVEAEPVLLGLDRAGIAAHSGSACAAEAFEPSPVLEAMGIEPSRSLRLSVGWTTTDRDVEAFAAAFAPVVEGLRALRA